MLSLDEINKELRQLAKSKKKGILEARKTLNKVVKPLIAEEIGIEIKCPKCKSKKYTKNGEGRFKCKDCTCHFSPMSNTIFKKYKYSKEEWLIIIREVLNNTSLISAGAIIDGLDKNRMHTLRIKILSALANVPQPKLSGIVQIDGTYFRESQKESRKLKSFNCLEKQRAPRKANEWHPSKSGIFGQEFVCCICGADSQGWVFADCTGLGQPDYKTLKGCLDKHLNSPSFICTDGYEDYEVYCDEYSYQHHITPSTYKNDLKLSGYIYQNEKTHPEKLTQEEIQQNIKLEKKLFNEGCGLKICNSGKMSYETYTTIIKNQGGKDLFNLDKVNKLHGTLKNDFAHDAQNVSSKYLQLYIALDVYKHNFNTKYGHRISSRKDLEIVLDDVIKYYKEEDYKKIINADLAYIPIKDAKKDRKGYKALKCMGNVQKDIFNSTRLDNIEIFNKRKCFRNMAPHRINYLCKYFDIPIKGRNKTQKADALASLPNADDIIFREIYLLYFANQGEVLDAITNGFFEKKKPNKKNINELAIDIDYVNLKKKIFLDVETTGLDMYSGDEILSLTMMNENGVVLYDSYFKPEHHIRWDDAMRINHITPEKVKDAPRFKEESFKISSIISQYEMVVGFNVEFDINFLKHNHVSCDLELFDVMTKFKQVYSLYENRSLKEIAKFYKYKWEDKEHSSIGDIKATLYCFKELIKSAS